MQGADIIDEPKIGAEMYVVQKPGSLFQDSFAKNGESLPSWKSLLSGAIDISIEKSGQISQAIFPKNSMSFVTMDVAGKEVDVQILADVPKQSHFLLYAPYSDKTLLRNSLSYKLSEVTGQPAPRTAFVEVFVAKTWNDLPPLENLRCRISCAQPGKENILSSDPNCDRTYLLSPRNCSTALGYSYQGVYVLTNKVRRSEWLRVQRSSLKRENVGVGGFIIRSDKVDNGDRYFPLDLSGIRLQANVYPHSATERQVAYIQNQMDEFERVLYGPCSASFSTPAPALKTPNGVYVPSVLSYESLIDDCSFVDYFLVQELTRNPDGYRWSTYMHRMSESEMLAPDGTPGTANHCPLQADSIQKRDNRIRMGPVWDFNIALGNADYMRGDVPQGWLFQEVTGQDATQNPRRNVGYWYVRLMEHPAFVDKLRARWWQLRSPNEEGPWDNDRLWLAVEAFILQLQGGTLKRNFERWNIMHQSIWPNPKVYNNYTDEVLGMFDFLQARASWMDASIDSLGSFDPAFRTAGEPKGFLASKQSAKLFQFGSLHCISRCDDGYRHEVVASTGKEEESQSQLQSQSQSQQGLVASYFSMPRIRWALSYKAVSAMEGDWRAGLKWMDLPQVREMRDPVYVDHIQNITGTSDDTWATLAQFSPYLQGIESSPLLWGPFNNILVSNVSPATHPVRTDDDDDKGNCRTVSFWIKALTVSSEHKYSNEGVAQLFDGAIGTKWVGTATRQSSSSTVYYDPSHERDKFASVGYIDISLHKEASVTSYIFSSANDVPERDPIHWVLEVKCTPAGDYPAPTGAWVVVDEQNLLDEDAMEWGRHKSKTFCVKNPGPPSSKYRIRILQLRDPHSSIVQLSEVALMDCSGEGTLETERRSAKRAISEDDNVPASTEGDLTMMAAVVDSNLTVALDANKTAADRATDNITSNYDGTLQGTNETFLPTLTPTALPTVTTESPTRQPTLPPLYCKRPENSTSRATSNHTCSKLQHLRASVPQVNTEVGINGLLLSDWATQYDGYLWIPEDGNWSFMTQRPDLRRDPQVRLGYNEVSLQMDAEIHLWMDGNMLTEMDSKHPAGYSNIDDNSDYGYFWSSSINTVNLYRGYHRIQLQMHVQSSIRGLKVGMCRNMEPNNENQTNKLLRFPIHLGGNENASCITRQSFMGITEKYLRSVSELELKDVAVVNQKNAVLKRVGICGDINECQENALACNEGIHGIGEWKCENTLGSFECQPVSVVAVVADKYHSLFYTPLGLVIFILSGMALLCGIFFGGQITMSWCNKCRNPLPTTRRRREESRVHRYSTLQFMEDVSPGAGADALEAEVEMGSFK
jgi:hypothetical protein